MDDGDATLVLFTKELGNGSSFTAEYALSVKKPILIVNISDEQAIIRTAQWLKINDFKVLNIAGPRESSSPGIYSLSKDFLNKVFSEK